MRFVAAISALPLVTGLHAPGNLRLSRAKSMTQTPVDVRNFNCDNNLAVVYLIDATASMNHHEFRNEVLTAEAMHKKLSDKVEGTLAAAVYIFGGWEENRESFTRMDLAPGTYTLVKENAFCQLGQRAQKKQKGKLTLQQCAEKCKIRELCRFFSFGKETGANGGECHLQYTQSKSCPEGWRRNSNFDFYKLGDNWDELVSDKDVFENLRSMVNQPEDFRGERQYNGFSIWKYAMKNPIKSSYQNFMYGTLAKKALHESYRVLGNAKKAVENKNAGSDKSENWTYLTILLTDGESDDCDDAASCTPTDKDIKVATVHLGHQENASTNIYQKLAGISGCKGWKQIKSKKDEGEIFVIGKNGKDKCPYMISRTASWGEESVQVYDWAQKYAETMTSEWLYSTDRYCPAGHAIKRNADTQKLYCEFCPYGSAITGANQLDMCMDQTTECNDPATPEPTPDSGRAPPSEPTTPKRKPTCRHKTA